MTTDVLMIAGFAPLWRMDEALAFIRPLDAFMRERGYYLGLTGGVLVRGASHKDLDVAVFSLGNKALKQGITPSMQGAIEALKAYPSLTQEYTLGEVAEYDPDRDSQPVEVWYTTVGDGLSKRVDFFFHIAATETVNT